MTLEEVLQMVDEFGQAARDPTSMSVAELNRKRELLHYAIRRLVTDDPPVAQPYGQIMTDNESSFQARVRPWLFACFDAETVNSKTERNRRFLEEALELVQACECSEAEAHMLVDYVYGRSAGTKVQEVGGVMVTLAALCLAYGTDMYDAGELELKRCWTNIERIREKQAQKPKDLKPNPSRARVRPLEWSEVCPPNDKKHYHHVTAGTPFGEICITWKGWSDSPVYDVEFPWDGPWLSEFTLENAKQAATEEWIENISNMLE